MSRILSSWVVCWYVSYQGLNQLLSLITIPVSWLTMFTLSIHILLS